MMKTSLLFAASTILGSAIAKQCMNLTIPVNISVRQAVFGNTPTNSNYDVTRFSINFTNIHHGGNLTSRLLRGYQTVEGRYYISAKFCRPNVTGSDNSTVQVLIHGIGFDKTYWDLPFNAFNYSYESVAVDAYGFSTLAIDRLGIAGSSHGEPLNEIQAPLSMSAINEITTMLRQGTIPSIDQKFSQVVHVGHSFGAFLSYFLVTMHPNASDGLVLTGYSNNATWFKQTIAGWNLHLANLNQPMRFGDAAAVPRSTASSLILDLVTFTARAVSILLPRLSLRLSQVWQDLATTEAGDILTGYNCTVPGQNLPNGYLTWSDWTANTFAFFHPPHYDLSISLFAERTKQPTTTGELLTIGLAAPTAPDFQGPVLVLTGRQDAIYCGGDCLAAQGTGYDSIPAALKAAVPAARRFDAVVQPHTGHGINFHYNSTAAYHIIQRWLWDNGLQSS